jgi:hypothetical protein
VRANVCDSSARINPDERNYSGREPVHARERRGARTRGGIRSSERASPGLGHLNRTPPEVQWDESQSTTRERDFDSRCSFISAMFLCPTVTLSTPAFRSANFIAAWRSSRLKLPSPTNRRRNPGGTAAVNVREIARHPREQQSGRGPGLLAERKIEPMLEMALAILPFWDELPFRWVTPD